ncbi:hypothetical protein Syun_006761 [Stephania yunnanensis]|uniref:Uncharacterized protein n=1 Tax=Stephania yunnanensis TaxID=152371 RepID=A0AAP0PYT3_9MAGN
MIKYIYYFIRSLHVNHFSVFCQHVHRCSCGLQRMSPPFQMYQTTQSMHEEMDANILKLKL